MGGTCPVTLPTAGLAAAQEEGVAPEPEREEDESEGPRKPVTGIASSLTYFDFSSGTAADRVSLWGISVYVLEQPVPEGRFAYGMALDAGFGESAFGRVMLLAAVLGDTSSPAEPAAYVGIGVSREYTPLSLNRDCIVLAAGIQIKVTRKMCIVPEAFVLNDAEGTRYGFVVRLADFFVY